MSLERELEQVRLLFDQNSSVITALRAEQSVIQRELVESKTTASRATQEASTLRASNVNLSNAFESLEEENTRLHAALDKLQDLHISEMSVVEQERADMLREMLELKETVETLKKDRDTIETSYSRENDKIQTKVALLEKDVMYGNEKVESLLEATKNAESKSTALEKQNNQLQKEVESYKRVIQKLEDDASSTAKHNESLTQQIRELDRQREQESKEAHSREERLLEELSLYKNKLAVSEKQVETLEGNVALETAYVAKYKRMVGEIGRLVNWAQTSAPGSAAITAALAAAKSTGEENGGKPSPAAQAALRVARMSLATGTSILGDATNAMR